MADTARLAAFWLDFDNTFQSSTAPSSEVREAVARMDQFGNKQTPRVPYRWRVMCRSVEEGGVYADAFREFVDFAAQQREDLALLADLQLQVIDKHFNGDAQALRAAFLLFGSGTLNRPGGSQHVMERAEVAKAKERFTIWFAFARAASRHAPNAARWLQLATLIGVACSCHVRLRPSESATNTAILDDAEATSLVRTWQADAAGPIDEERLDQEFWRLVRK